MTKHTLTLLIWGKGVSVVGGEMGTVCYVIRRVGQNNTIIVAYGVRTVFVAR
jgi:hypothetical protein